MFADILAMRTMLAVEIAPDTNKTVRSYSEDENDDPYYANQGEVSKWTAGSYATSCADYDSSACHYGPYTA